MKTWRYSSTCANLDIHRKKFMAVLILSEKNLSWDNCFRKSIDNKTIEAGNRRERLIVISAKFLCAHIVLLWIMIPIALNPNYCFFRGEVGREKHANKQIEKGKTLMQLFWKGLNARWCVEVSYMQKFIQFVLNAKFQTYKWCKYCSFSDEDCFGPVSSSEFPLSML